MYNHMMKQEVKMQEVAQAEPTDSPPPAGPLHQPHDAAERENDTAEREGQEEGDFSTPKLRPHKLFCVQHFLRAAPAG